AKNGVNIAYSIPKQGALAFFDMLAIPKDAKNVDEAYQFINYLMEPKVMAQISNTVFYASGVKASLPFVDPAIRDNPGIYPTADTMAKLFTLKVQEPKLDRVRTRAWTKVKSGK
ncbi:MAG TPA: spermidine/putrescine ABC transporter substrate-binding protein PotF, partial [Erwinia persicina]|nr:spermidine/putrescine ABC transporter substrate-binding protein PotF [Erwinia persicina]